MHPAVRRFWRGQPIGKLGLQGDESLFKADMAVQEFQVEPAGLDPRRVNKNDVSQVWTENRKDD
jgi:hypothetical protein